MDAFDAFCALGVSSPDEEMLRDLRGASVDWELAAQSAISSGCPFLFYVNATKAGLGPFSRETGAELERLRQEALGRGLALTRCFYETAGALTAAGIGFAPLKGLSLLSSGVYPDEGSRAVSDLDFFLAPEDFPRARAALSALGCRPNEEPLRNGVMRNHGQEIVYLRPDGAQVDLHHRLFPWYEERHLYKINSRLLFGEARESQWRGIRMRFLRAEDEFYYALLSWRAEPGSFRYAFDADALARRPGADWDRAARHLVSSPLRNTLASSIRFLREKMRTPFPAPFLAALPRVAAAAPRPHGRFFGTLAAAGTVEDRAALAVLFFRWQLFKRLGLYSGYFAERNNPAGKVL